MRTCPNCKTKYPMNTTFCLQDGTALVDTPELTEGSVIKEKYRILSKTGQGDMSIVYSALHLRLDEVRSLKVMEEELASDPLFRKRFEQEALLTRKLQHANVVRVDDIDETDDGRPFMVMECVEGDTLKKVIQDGGPLPVARACAIAKQVASALDAAHELGMIHRDIKPDNIVLVQTPSGEQAKVLEFGMAKLKEARVGDKAGMLTLTGALAIIGTPQYMSPELALGKRGDDLDGRSDIYSLGIVMYEMLTGALPFKSGTVMNMVFAHIQTPPKPILTVRPDLAIPEPVAAVVMKCLEKNRDSRPASGKALIAELEKAGGLQPERPLAAQPTPPAQVRPPAPPPAPPAPVAVSAPRVDAVLSPSPKVPVAAVTAPAKRSPLAKIVLVLVALIGVAVGGWYVVSRSRKPVEVVPATPSQQSRDVAPSPPKKPKEATQPAPEAPSATQETAQPSSRSTADSQREITPEAVPTRTTEPRRAAKPDLGKQIEAAAKLGDVYYENGQYDKAIAEYEKGLRLDPSNAQLREKIQRAQTAKATEEFLK